MPVRFHVFIGMICLAVPLCSVSSAEGEVIKRTAKDTLTAIEMNHGDQLQFTLRSGRVCRIELEGTSARIVQRVNPGGIIYRFDLHLQIDGQPLRLRRYTCSQECFYEPYVVNGVRIWPDTVKKVFDLVPIRLPGKGHLQCLPRKDARFAIQDATLRTCPDSFHRWMDDLPDFIDVGRCYNGDDCYLGPYLGQACHIGLDINHAKGSFLYAPIDFDVQGYFNSLATGHNNNRWRGIRIWPNGDIWALQSHHLIDLLVPQNRPLKKGTKYATTAGVRVGSHQHSHFEFKVGYLKQPTDPKNPQTIKLPIDFDDNSPQARRQAEVFHLDPWILYWQIFEDHKAHREQIAAGIEPLRPVRAGEKTRFSAAGTRPGKGKQALRYHWTFGDGGFSTDANPVHVFSAAGCYPVTLVVDNGADRARTTQHISVTGPPVEQETFVLTADDTTFTRQRSYVAHVYGTPPRHLPHTVRFRLAPDNTATYSHYVQLKTISGRAVPQVSHIGIKYDQGDHWLTVQPAGAEKNKSLSLVVDSKGLAEGEYAAVVSVECTEALNPIEEFRVQLTVRSQPAVKKVVLDDQDDGFYATPYFWVGHRFSRCPKNRRGYQGFYRTGGDQSSQHDFVRFAPDLPAGSYEVRFAPQTPFAKETEFTVRFSDDDGNRTMRAKPVSNPLLGTLRVGRNRPAYVEFQAKDSKGKILADALIFERIAQ